MTRGDAATFPFEEAIAEAGRNAGVDLAPAAIAALAAHARLVLAENPILHLTSVTEPAAFVARHVGESLHGAALLDPARSGTLLDLGSGNGYPGLAIALARAGLRPVLAESSAKKARFLRAALDAAGRGDGTVLEASVQRASDLASVGGVDVVTTRAMGGWERIVPRLLPAMSAGGTILVWAGAAGLEVVSRRSWSKLPVTRVHAIPGRDVSKIVEISI